MCVSYILAWSVFILLHTNRRLRFSEIRSNNSRFSLFWQSIAIVAKQLAPTTTPWYMQMGIDVCSFYHDGIAMDFKLIVSHGVYVNILYCIHIMYNIEIPFSTSYSKSWCMCKCVCAKKSFETWQHNHANKSKGRHNGCARVCVCAGQFAMSSTHTYTHICMIHI